MEIIDSAWLVILLVLIPIFYIVFCVFKGITTKSIFKFGISFSILSGILIELVAESHPHVPSFIMIVLMPLLCVIIICVTVFIRYIYQLFNKT